ncbi:hypothetical protein LguiB_005339 [Lonicera macranthoides]
MENQQQAFIDFLREMPRNYFWSKSQKNDAFRLAKMFSKFIKSYIKKMQASHAYRRHHGWDSGLMQMILINNGDVENLSFAREPVALNADDDLDEKKRSDYIHLANLIEAVHGYYFLPDISRETSPDLERFLRVLRASTEFDERYIRKHDCLWDFNKRTYFMVTLDAKQKYVPFAKMISDEFDALSPFRFDIAYPNGFWNVYAYDPFNKVINCRRSGVKPRKPPYENSFAGFMKFIGNIFTQSLAVKNNPYCKLDMEWRIYEEFPFYLHLICQILERLDLYMAYV